jgi:hypothetical protein
MKSRKYPLQGIRSRKYPWSKVSTKEQGVGSELLEENGSFIPPRRFYFRGFRWTSGVSNKV